MEVCPCGTGRRRGIGSPTGRGVGRNGAFGAAEGADGRAAGVLGAAGGAFGAGVVGGAEGGSAGVTGASAAGCAAGGGATLRGVVVRTGVVTGRRRGASGSGARGFGAAAGAGFSATGSGCAGALGVGVAAGGALGAADAVGLSSTLRTRSATWSGTTVRAFFASKRPPRRSLKSTMSSFDESPTSFASSKILTFRVANVSLSQCSPNGSPLLNHTLVHSAQDRGSVDSARRAGHTPPSRDKPPAQGAVAPPGRSLSSRLPPARIGRGRAGRSAFDSRRTAAAVPTPATRRLQRAVPCGTPRVCG